MMGKESQGSMPEVRFIFRFCIYQGSKNPSTSSVLPVLEKQIQSAGSSQGEVWRVAGEPSPASGLRACQASRG